MPGDAPLCPAAQLARRGARRHDHGRLPGMGGPECRRSKTGCRTPATCIWQLSPADRGGERDISWRSPWVTVKIRLSTRWTPTTRCTTVPRPLRRRFSSCPGMDSPEPTCCEGQPCCCARARPGTSLRRLQSPGLWMAHCHIAEPTKRMMFSFNPRGVSRRRGSVPRCPPRACGGAPYLLVSAAVQAGRPWLTNLARRGLSFPYRGRPAPRRPRVALAVGFGCGWFTPPSTTRRPGHFPLRPNLPG